MSAMRQSPTFAAAVSFQYYCAVDAVVEMGCLGENMCRLRSLRAWSWADIPNTDTHPVKTHAVNLNFDIHKYRI